MIGIDFGFGALEQELWRLVFVMTRIGAALLAAPLFGATGVPVQLRVAIAGAIGVMVCAWTPLVPPPALLSVEGMVTILREVAIGLSLGFVLQVSFAAPVIAAELIGGTMGMGIATAIDPNTGANSPALGQFFTIVLTVVFLALGAHLQWLALLVRSYETFPPGAPWFDHDRMAEIAGYGSQMLATAVAIALPVTLVLLLVQVLTGVLSRSAPALNLFALGLPAGVLAGLAALIIAMPVVTEQFITLSGSMIDQATTAISPR